MNTVDEFINAATKYYEDVKSDENGRYRSWEHCYARFNDARNGGNNDTDYLSLHLAFYLASWGMYRGSSFLLQKDYRIHTPVVETILDHRYDMLFGVDCFSIKDVACAEKLKDLNTYIAGYYDNIRRTVKGQELKYQLSATLITKVLIGILGCVPAYDRYFVAGIKKTKTATGNYNMRSIRQLADFYEKNFDRMEECRQKMAFNGGLLYPPMKLLDMGFWQIGYDLEN